MTNDKTIRAFVANTKPPMTYSEKSAQVLQPLEYYDIFDTRCPYWVHKSP